MSNASGEAELVIGMRLEELQAVTDPLDFNPEATPGITPWPYYIGEFQDETGKDEAVCIYDAGTFTEGRLHKTGETQEKELIMIRVRAKDRLVAKAKAVELRNLLDSKQFTQVEVTVEPVLEGQQPRLYKICAVNLTSGVRSIGRDDALRYHFVVNASTTIRLVPQE